MGWLLSACRAFLLFAWEQTKQIREQILCICRAPEKLRRGSDKFRISRASDIWSLGITLLQLSCCDVGVPFPGMDTGNIAVQVSKQKLG